MRSNSKPTIRVAFFIVVGFALVFTLSSYLEKNRVSLPEAYEDADLELQGKRLKGYALGAEGLLADWYWMRSLQYIGGKISKSEAEVINVDDLTSLNPRLLYPLLDNASDLDPKFMAVYSYGASVLPAIDPSQAIRLTEKGIANNPDAWRLYQYLGYIHWRLKNYEQAAEIYDKGSRVPGAASFMRQMAAVMKTRGGDRETARRMYSQMLAEAEDQQTKNNAGLRLLELDSLDERDALNAALEEFKKSNGRCASRFDEIFHILRGVKLPGNKDFQIDTSGRIVDPTGAPYDLDQTACKARLNPKSKLPKDQIS